MAIFQANVGWQAGPQVLSGNLMQNFCLSRCLNWCQAGETLSRPHPFFVHQLL